MDRIRRRLRARRERSEARKQAALDEGLARFEQQRADLFEELRAVGHDPTVVSRWDNEYGWRFSTQCRKCGRTRRALRPGRLGGLSPKEPCEGAGPRFEEWMQEGAKLGVTEAVEVRAPSLPVATALAIEQLGLPESQVEIRVAGEGTPGGRRGRYVVVWARRRPQ